MTQNRNKISSSTEPFTLTDWDKKAFSVIPVTEMHPDSIRLNWLIELLKSPTPYQHFSIQFPNAELVQFVHTHLTTSDPCPIEECEVWGEAQYPDFRQAIDKAMAHYEMLCQQEMEQPKMSMIEQLKQKFPKCCNILSLVQHLHSDCADPENAAYATLEWLSEMLKSNNRVHTHMVFSDGQNTGKGLFCETILMPIFGEKAKFGDSPELENTNHSKFCQPNFRLHLAEITNSNPFSFMTAKIQALNNAKGYNKPVQGVIFLTNQFIGRNPANRTFRIARCRTPISEGLYKAVEADVRIGSLMQFADLLHTIYGSTDELHNLNAIY